MGYQAYNAEVTLLRGLTTKAEAKKAAKAAAAKGKGKVDADDVEAQSCRDLSNSQEEMIGALLTDGIGRAIAGGDTYLALKTLLTPLIGQHGKHPGWAGLHRSFANFTGVNTMFDDKLVEIEPDKTAFPTREVFEKMPWDQVMAIVRTAALASMTLLRDYDTEAVGELKASGTVWFRYDAGFLRRYRLDALQDLAKKLKVPFEGLKKMQLVDAILKHPGEPYMPARVSRVRE